MSVCVSSQSHPRTLSNKPASGSAEGHGKITLFDLLFTIKETRVQRGELTCPRSPRRKCWSWNLKHNLIHLVTLPYCLPLVMASLVSLWTITRGSREDRCCLLLAVVPADGIFRCREGQLCGTSRHTWTKPKGPRAMKLSLNAEGVCSLWWSGLSHVYCCLTHG